MRRWIFSSAPWLASLVDGESVLGIAAKLANSGAYLASALLTGIFLTLPEQGLFFTLLSFATLTVVVELGLGTVVIQFISHEMAAVELAVDDAERKRAISRLRSIGRFAFIWFWFGAALFLVFAGASGYFFFAGVPGASAVLPGPWCVLAVLVSLDLSLTPFWTILEGSRRIKAVYAYRTMKGLVLGLGIGISLALGLRLWALPIGFIFTLPVAVWPILSNWDFFRMFLLPAGQDRVSWRGEMMPLQWRIAISWVAGYFMNWAITPIALKMFGGATAGQVGMTWALATGVTTISSSVVIVKSSRFGYLVARREFAELDRFVLRQGAICIMLSLLGVSIIVGLDLIGTRLGLHAATRVLPIGALALFLLGSVIQQATLPLAAYLRSFKREPFMWPSVIAAILFLGTFIAAGRSFGIYGVAIGYVAIAIFFVVPVATIIFWICRRSWTAPCQKTEACTIY